MLLSLLRLRRGFHNASFIAPPAVGHLTTLTGFHSTCRGRYHSHRLSLIVRRVRELRSAPYRLGSSLMAIPLAGYFDDVDTWLPLLGVSLIVLLALFIPFTFMMKGLMLNASIDIIDALPLIIHAGSVFFRASPLRRRPLASVAR